MTVNINLCTVNCVQQPKRRMGYVRVQSDSVDEKVDENENIKRPEFDFETAVLKWKNSKDRSMYELKKKNKTSKLLSLSTEFEADFIHLSICGLLLLRP